METATVTHSTFVDFENVPDVDLSLIAAKPVHVTLLIGKSQRKLDLSLVRQIHRQHAQVELVEVGGSGRNALDLTLAVYLGQAVERTPAVEFYIVSKDKDFDPMIAHLQNKGIKVSRCESFSSLPFLPAAKLAPAAKKQTKPRKTQANPTIPPSSVDLKLQKLITRLKNNLGPRPKRKDSLLNQIGSAFGNKLSEAEQLDLLQQLVAGNVVRIDSADNVSY